jgi:hypothetical protein
MNSKQPLELHDVTLCAVDSINPALAARALDISMSQCTFGDAILFTQEAVPTSARCVPIAPLQSREAYSAFMLKQLVGHITTPWVLVVQWDGYVLDASRWSDAFLEYDYIGASWPWHRDGMAVGNGGFSLRSTRLLEALANDRFQIPAGGVEDVLVCRTWRPILEADYGIRFAPVDVAGRFAYERARLHFPTFGFHGVFNMWRHVDDETMMRIIRSLDVRTFSSREGLELLPIYCELRKFSCAKSMYERYRSIWSVQELTGRLVDIGVRRDAAESYLALCERL